MFAQPRLTNPRPLVALVRKDQKRIRKRGEDMIKLPANVKRLVEGADLEPRYKPHPLTGDWKPLWDLHIEPDWLLIYQMTGKEVYLAQTGTYADLF